MNSINNIKKQLEEICMEESNSFCFDCGNKPVNWASISNGIFLCLDCSSEHRGYGIEISFIRSVTMDQWTQGQVNIMKVAGNKRLKDFLIKYEMPENIDRKIIYYSNLMNFYRKQIYAESKGQFNMEPLPSKKDFWTSINSYNDLYDNNNDIENNSQKKEIIIDVDQYKYARNKSNLSKQISENKGNESQINFNTSLNIEENDETIGLVEREQTNLNNNNSLLSSYINMLPNTGYFGNVKNILNNINGFGSENNSQGNNSINKYELRNDFLSLGSKTLGGISYMGGKMIEKGINILKSDTMKNIYYKTGEGLWYLKEKIIGSGNKDNPNDENIDEEFYSFLQPDYSE